MVLKVFSATVVLNVALHYIVHCIYHRPYSHVCTLNVSASSNSYTRSNIK